MAQLILSSSASGYTLEAFGEVDQQIAALRYSDRGTRPPTERYGKKYARIAYFEQYVRLRGVGSTI